MKLQEKLKKIVEENSVFEKPFFFGGIIIGFIYLNGYLSEFDIPFPLDIGLMPTTLIVIGSMSLVILLIILGYLLLVGFINLDPFSTNFHRLINTDANGMYVRRLRNSIKYALISYVFPFAAFVILVGYYRVENSNWVYGSIFGGYAIWAFIYSLALVKKSNDPIRKKIENAFLMTLHVFLVQFISVLSLAVFIIIIIARAKDITELELLLLIVCHAVTNFICILPIFSKVKFDELHESDKKLTADQFIQKTQQYPTYFIMGVLLVFSLTPNISPYVGELPLRVLNIGGGIEMIVKDSRKQCDAWPDFIIQKKDETSCVTKSGKLVIQLGNRAYFVFHNKKEGELVISLDLSKSAIAKKLPEKNYYYNRTRKSHNQQEVKKTTEPKITKAT